MTSVRNDIRAELDNLLADLPVGDRLPSERELAQRLGVARMTLRRSMDPLVLDGRLERRPGAGTYVRQPAMTRHVGLTSFTQDVTRRGARPGGRVVEFRSRAASGELAGRLAIPVGERVLRITRVRTADDQPVAVETVDIPTVFVPGITPDDVCGSLYSLLRATYGIELASATLALTPELPDRRTAELLAVTPTTPCLLVDMTDVDRDGRTVMVARCHYRGDRYRMTMRVVDDGRGD